MVGRRDFDVHRIDSSQPPSCITSRGATRAMALSYCVEAARGAVRVPPQSHFQPVVTALKKPRPLLPMLVVGACLAAVLTAVIVVIVLMSGSPSPPPTACWSHECLEYGKLLRSSIDDSVAPCHNFTRFVCGGWRREHRLSVREELYERAMERMTRLVRTIEVPAKDQNSVQRAAAVYRSCDDVLQGERDELEAVKNYLLEAGITWPIRSRNRDVVHTLLFSSLRLGWHVILRVEPRWSGKGAPTFLVDPGGAFHLVIRPREVNDLELYFKRLMETFGGAAGNNMVSFEDVVEAEDSFRDTLTAAYNDRTEYQDFPERTFLGLGENRWIDVLKSFNISVGKHFQLLTTGRRFVYAFFNLWDNYGEEGAYGYTSWCTVQLAALYANRQLVLNYHGGSVRRAQAYYGAFCVTAAYTFSRYALFGGYNIEVLRGQTRAVAEGVTRAVGDSFMRRLSRWKHLKNVEIVTNWSSLSRVFRGFEAANDATRGSTGLDMTKSFVENWRKSTLIPSSPDDWILVAVINSLELFALYAVGDRRDFQLLPAALSFPFFDLGLTAPVNYGGLGAHVAWALGMLFLAAYGSDQSAKTTVEHLKNCVASKSNAIDTDAVTAVAATAGALLDAMESNSDAASRLPIPQLESFSATQLFFVSLCFAHCEGSDSAGNWAGICDHSLRHVRSFAQAFGCVPASPMNPEQRCDVP